MYRDLPTTAGYVQNTAEAVTQRIEALEDKVRQLELIIERISTKMSQLERRGRESSTF